MAVLTFENISEARNSVSGMFTQLHEKLSEDESYFELEFADELKLPAKFKNRGIVLPTAREIVETAVNHISTYHRRVEVPRRTPTKRGTEQAQLLRRFYEALLNYLENQGLVSPYRELMKHVVLYGICIAKFVYDKKQNPRKPRRNEFKSEDEYKAAITDYNYYKTETMPFSIQVLHPSEVYFDPFHDQPEWVIQCSKKYVYELNRNYPEWGNPKSRKPFDQVEVLEYWDKEYMGVDIEGDPAMEVGMHKHGWGAHPYVFMASGLGNEAKDHALDKRFVGLMRHVKRVLESESRNYSIADIVNVMGAWPVRTVEGERANEMHPIEYEYGQIIPIPPGTKVNDLAPQLVPDQVYQHLSVASAIISAATAPRVVRGQREPGTRTGYQHQLTLAEAKLMYNSFAEAGSKLLTLICKKSAMYMENAVRNPVNVDAGARRDEFKPVSKSTFRGHHAVDVKINVQEPEDEIRKQQNYAAMVGSGIMSAETAIKNGQPDVDPTEELGRILGNRALLSEGILQIVVALASNKLQDKMALQEQIAQMLPTGGTGQAPPAKQTEDTNRQAQAVDRDQMLLPGREMLGGR